MASLQEVPEFDSTIWSESFRILWRPPAAQRHAVSVVLLIGDSKLLIDVNVSVNSSLSLCVRLVTIQGVPRLSPCRS